MEGRHEARLVAALLLLYFFLSWYFHWRPACFTDQAGPLLDRIPTWLPLPDSPLSRLATGYLTYLLGFLALGAALFAILPGMARLTLPVLGILLACKLAFWSLDQRLWTADHDQHFFWIAIFLVASRRVAMFRASVAAAWLAAAAASLRAGLDAQSLVWLFPTAVLPWFWFAPWRPLRRLATGLCALIAAVLVVARPADTPLLLCLGTALVHFHLPDDEPTGELLQVSQLPAWLLLVALVGVGSSAPVLPPPGPRPAALYTLRSGSSEFLVEVSAVDVRVSESQDGRALRTREPLRGRLKDGDRVLFNSRAVTAIPETMAGELAVHQAYARYIQAHAPGVRVELRLESR